MSDDKSILVRMEEQGQQAPRVNLKGTERNAQATERYEIVGEIARGGVGRVHRGRDNDIGRDVALKVLLDGHLGNPELVQRFVEEAQIGGQLQHPGIVPVYELGLRSDGQPFFAMKLVKGETLAARLATGESRRRELMAVFRDVCRTMSYAHARGVIHRDLKPSNIMIGNFGEVQVVDWGFAKVMRRGGVADERLAKKAERDVTMISTVRSGDDGSAPSVAGAVMGTPAYMPPEQALGRVEDLDERSDIFSLGAILCEILTGKPPYVEDRMNAAAHALLEPAHKRLDECGADARLVSLCRRCLEPLPKDRPPRADELAEETAAYLASAEGRAHRARVRALKAGQRADEQKRARRFTTLIGTAVVLALAVGTGAYFRIDAGRAERARERQAAIDAAVQDAERLRAARDWPAALAAAEGARELGDDGTLADAIRGEAAAADDARQRREEEATLLAELEVARARDGDHYDEAAIEAAYVAAVRKLWPSMDVDTERLKNSDEATALAAAFDAWALLRQDMEGKDWKQPDGWARAIDPASNALRDAIASGDAATLEKLLADLDVDTLPLATIANVSVVLKNRKEAETEFLQRAHRRHPGDFWVNYLLGTLAAKRDPELAARHLQAAIAIRPHSIEARHWLGLALSYAGDHEGAVTVWRDAMQRDPDWTHGLGHIAEALGKLGQHDEALSTFREAIRRANDSWGTYLRMGAHLIERGRYEDAAEAFQRAVKLNPDRTDSFNWLGQALSRQGDWEGAIEAHRFARVLDPGNRTANNRIIAAMKELRPDDEGYARCRKAVEREPDNPDHHVALVEHLAARREYKAAHAALQRAVELRPDGATYQFRLGVFYFHMSGSGPNRATLEKALTRIRRAIELDASEAEFYSMLGNALQWTDRAAEAEPHLRKAIALDPEYMEPRIHLAFGLANSGKLDEGIAEIRKALAIDERSVEGWQHLADLLARKGDEQGYVDAFRRAAELDPKLRYRFASRLDGLLRYDEAATEFRRILKERPEFGTVRYSLGTTLYRKDAFEKAIPELKKAIEIYPAYAEAYCNIGWSHRSLGQWTEALTWFKQGHEWGSKRKSWSYPSAQWIGEVEQMIALEPKLTRLLHGDEIEATPKERALLAEMLAAKGKYALSAQCYRDTFTAGPSLGAYGRKLLYPAIRTAARAGEPWRDQTFEWMRAMLTKMQRVVRIGPGGVYSDLTRWHRDPALAAVRDAAQLSSDWKKLWADAAALRAKAHRVATQRRK
jgi:serine/threonine-protein kinase